MGTWERLALLKAWPVAGDRALGRTFLEMAREFIYDLPFDVKAREDVVSMKRRIDEEDSRFKRGCHVERPRCNGFDPGF